MDAPTTLLLTPADAGRRLSLEEFGTARGQAGHLYELERGVLLVVEVPGLPHADVVRRLRLQLSIYEASHPEVVRFSGGGAECALRLPGLQSGRHPDWAIYLTPEPDATNPWDTWIPDIVVEVVSKGGEKRDYQDKREEYLLAGCREYWIIDPAKQSMLALTRRGDVWQERIVAERYSSPLLPGLELDVAVVIGESRE